MSNIAEEKDFEPYNQPNLITFFELQICLHLKKPIKDWPGLYFDAFKEFIAEKVYTIRDRHPDPKVQAALDEFWHLLFGDHLNKG